MPYEYRLSSSWRKKAQTSKKLSSTSKDGSSHWEWYCICWHLLCPLRGRLKQNQSRKIHPTCFQYTFHPSFYTGTLYIARYSRHVRGRFKVKCHDTKTLELSIFYSTITFLCLVNEWNFKIHTNTHTHWCKIQQHQTCTFTVMFRLCGQTHIQCRSVRFAVV